MPNMTSEIFKPLLEMFKFNVSFSLNCTPHVADGIKHEIRKKASEWKQNGTTILFKKLEFTDSSQEYTNIFDI